MKAETETEGEAKKRRIKTMIEDNLIARVLSGKLSAVTVNLCQHHPDGWGTKRQIRVDKAALGFIAETLIPGQGHLPVHRTVTVVAMYIRTWVERTHEVVSVTAET